jgi:PhoPQ-activated pathogenicity-related protein
MKAPPTRTRERSFGKLRQLVLEPLEERQLLDAGAAGQIAIEPAVVGSPWQNPNYRLDVNNDSSTTPIDALIIINRILAEGIGALPDPGPNPPQFYYDTSGDGRLTAVDLLGVINGILTPPQVVVSSLTPFTADVTPLVTVTATDAAGLPDGTIVNLDVDLNDDGDFSDPGELGHTQSTLFAGSSTFQITPALERTTELYKVNLRARVKDTDAVAGSSEVLPLGVDTLTSDALANYVNAPDDSYMYSAFGDPDTTNPAYSYYVLDMTSQTWRSTVDVVEPKWNHWIGVYVPNVPLGDTALMLIDGGSNLSGPPANSADDLGTVAALTGTVVFELTAVPNEPVMFTDETSPRSEDAIIAYTFNKYLEHIGEPGNETWPLLLPMVKSAVRAMDTIQDFIPSVRPGSAIDKFVVFGGSKRGWTTWLTAAVDDRVAAIMPGVIDVLNIAPQMVHHYGAYGFFSEAIQDYENLAIFDRLLTDEGRELFRIVDPYRYLNNGRFDDMPILIANSSGDQFFVSDSAQFYINDLPGNLHRLRYFPNTSHSLGEDPTAVLNSVASFYAAFLLGVPLPEYSWTVEQNGEIHVQTTATQPPSQVLLWQTTNPDARDFRKLVNPGLVWTSTPLVDQGGGHYVGDVPMPQSGATAYFVELTFPFPFPGIPPYVFTTEVRVKTELPLFDWPFYPGTPLPGGAPRPEQFVGAAHVAIATAAAQPVSIDASGRNAAASALAIQSVASELSVETSAIGLIPQASDEPELAAVDRAPAELMLPEAPPSNEPGDAESDGESVGDLLELALADLFA